VATEAELAKLQLAEQILASTNQLHSARSGSAINSIELGYGPRLQNMPTGDIVWIYGPFPCDSWPDLKIFRSNLKIKLAPREKLEADKATEASQRRSVLQTTQCLMRRRG
jgi:hypothetical protein